jgi:hypothetical protein
MSMITILRNLFKNNKRPTKTATEPLMQSEAADTTPAPPAENTVRDAEIIVLRLKKSDYSNMSKFLLRAGVVEGNQARPDQVYVSAADMRKFRAALTVIGRKQGLHGKQLEFAVNMEMLNLSPNGKLESVLKQGYAVVIK